MEINNANFGNIYSNGGSIQLGNNYITNVFEGLDDLSYDFKEQLKTIEQTIYSFKPQTALDFLNNLEKRVTEKNIKDKDIVLSKIFFLKGICKRELKQYKKEDSAQDFIKASNLNPNENSFKERACVEYLNIDDKDKAKEKAEEILQFEEYNKSAWFVRAITSTDIKSFLSLIPKVVFENYNFRLSIISHIIETENLSFLNDLSEYNLALDIAFEQYNEVTFFNLEAWRLAIDLSINIGINDYPSKYISGEHFIMEDNPLIEKVFNLLELYVTKLSDTEIKDSISHQKFYYNYFGYLLTNKENYYQGIVNEYPNISKPFWFYTFSFCQILNHRKKFKKSLGCIVEYEQSDGVLFSEFYLVKSALFLLNGKRNEVVEIFKNYLKCIKIIEERNGINILNAFLNILFNKVDDNILSQQLTEILEKEFKNNELKDLFEITIRVRYLKENNDIISERLEALINYNHFDINWKNLIAENLNSIGRRKEAIQYLEGYVNKSIVSESLRFFIILLHEQLCDKNCQERGRYTEVLNLLKFWRLNSKYPDIRLLEYEHNLYTEINDLKSIEEIDEYLYINFPNNEQYILLYLNVLERTNNKEKIKEVSDKIDWNIDDERFGVTLAIVLMRNNVNTKKGFDILFQLASNPNNIIARKNYFASSLMLKEQNFFIAYDEVEIGCWVSYLVSDKKVYLKIERESGLQKEFIGRKVGESFTSVTSMSGKIISIQILEIINDAWYLLRMIQEEANNPVNELGFESLQLPPNIEDFKTFLQSHFGDIGTKEKEIKEKALDDYFNYRIGFSEVSRMVFRENYIDAYLHLTSFVGNRFTTIPSSLTKQIFYDNEKITYALDFSTLILFYFLEKELGFEFKHKYAVSYLLKNKIDLEIIELVNSPFSKMTIQITNQFIRKYDTPEDYNQKRIEFLQSLLDWIERNCVIDLVSEKLDLLPKFDDQEKLDDFMKLLVDNIYISDRQNFQLISSDSTLFLFSKRGNTVGNIVNAEKYLLAFYPEKCDTEFYRFLLKSNYIGININLETLKNEFYQNLGNGKNYYSICLENLQFTIHNNPQIIIMLSKFLKELYVMQVLTIEQKNNFAYNILVRAIYGMPKEILIAFNRKLLEDFRLLGYLSDELIKVFNYVLDS
ncbi:hypothetical protein BWK58_09075 [Flavobacterium columnare]|nr:hypothetical protein BWK58_09075 [Flavobacterium columnare]